MGHARITQEIFEKANGPATISQRIAISDHITDAKIIGANQEASALYGRSLTQLTNSWISEVTSPEDLPFARLLAVARTHGVKAAKHYKVRIRRGDGTTLYVAKHTRQYIEDGEEFWSTEITEPNNEPTAEQAVEDARIPTEIRDKAFSMMSVVDVEKLIQRYASTDLDSALTSDENNRIISSEGKSRKIILDRENFLSTQIISLGLGKSRKLPDGKWVHRCAKCGVTWNSRSKEPARCPRARKDFFGPRCASTTWRRVDTAKKRNDDIHQADEVSRDSPHEEELANATQ